VLLEFAERMPFTPWVRPAEKHAGFVGHRAAVLQALTKLCTAGKKKIALMPWAFRKRFPPWCGERHRPQPAISPAGHEEAAPTSAAVHRCGTRSCSNAISCCAASPGLGEISAVQTLAELLLLPADRDVRQWVAYAGLDPREVQLGYFGAQVHAQLAK